MLIEPNNIYNGDCLELMKSIPDNSIDAIITDPPYLFLKHKLDKKFDEQLFFEETFRIIKPSGFLVYFGRGISFHRWNVICDLIGFNWKEEVIWEKVLNSSPFLNINRIHETISMFSKGNSKLNKVYIDKIEYDSLSSQYQKAVTDWNRVVTAWRNGRKQDIIDYIETEAINYNRKGNKKVKDSILPNNRIDCERVCMFLKSNLEGILLKSIIRVPSEHYKYKHPTQKPIS